MTSERPIRVVVADDHPIVRSGIVGLLSAAEGFAVVGEASNGVEAVRLAAELRPDVVLLDLRMPVLAGAAATDRILATGLGVRVLVLTTYESDDDILGAIEAGASGYLLKAAPAEEIVAGLRAVVDGQTVLAPTVAAKLVDRVRSGPEGAPAVALSPREREVLALVAEGLSNPQIGARLFIGEATVKTHLIHVFDKLGVSDRTRAVTRAMELKLLPQR
ncbi:MAG TPA: response regulator transcription factor [Humibacter sp.]|nr:response regulator transcription factor [Humibacter sp.]